MSEGLTQAYSYMYQGRTFPERLGFFLNLDSGQGSPDRSRQRPKPFKAIHHMYICIYTYSSIYIYIERERDIEREICIYHVCVQTTLCIYIYIYIYLFMYRWRGFWVQGLALSWSAAEAIQSWAQPALCVDGAPCAPPRPRTPSLCVIVYAFAAGFG